MHRNRRTLKKRIRNIISFTIFFAVFLFSSIIMYGTVQAFKSQAVFISGYISNFLAKDMSSAFFLNELGIKGLEDFDPAGPKAVQWVDSMLESEKGRMFLKGFNVLPGSDSSDEAAIGPAAGASAEAASVAVPGTGEPLPPKVGIVINTNGKNIVLPNFGPSNMIHNVIVLNGTVVYESPHSAKEGFRPYPAAGMHDSTDRIQNHLFNVLMDYFSNSAVSTPLFSSTGKEIGSITTTVDSQYLVYIYIVLASAILLAGLFSLVLANMVGKLMSISITKPLMTLGEKIDALTREELAAGMDKQIQLKRPLREIENLADSTNRVMRKMQENSRLLGDQKQKLEDQNDELESQNEELVDSKKKIEQAQNMLVQSEKMASIGQLTAAITHEINTPLGAINSNVQLAEMLIGLLAENPLVTSSSELSDLVGKLRETNSINLIACGRVIEIIKNLKTFSKLDQAEFQEANLNEGIHSVLVLTSNLWKKKITIHEEYGDLPMVKCFPGLLNQVFMNILVNAIQAVENQGDIYIRTFEDQDNYNISFRDTGAGIRPADLPRIFDSGFSTKEAGIGAGIGLSICQNIMQKHNGRIDVTSQPGEGSEFIIRIPKALN